MCGELNLASAPTSALRMALALRNLEELTARQWLACFGVRYPPARARFGIHGDQLATECAGANSRQITGPDLATLHNIHYAKCVTGELVRS